MQTVEVSEDVMGAVITIDGVKYLRQESKMVDCDDNEIFLGEDVYVRESALNHYHHMNKSNRHGKLIGVAEGFLDVELEDGRKWHFPANHIRRQG
jgi:hypothetical protein